MKQGQSVLIRTSERKSYKTCRQQWYWGYVKHWESKRVGTALRFGDLAHQSLAAYYRPGLKRGPHPALTFEEVYRAQIEAGMDEFGMKVVEDDETWVDALDLGVAVLDHYVEHYGLDPHLKVIAPEMPFEVNLGPLFPGGPDLIYVGILDAVVLDRNTNQTGILEHKTAAAISTTHLPLDEQAGSYWAIAPMFLRQKGILKPGQELDFILYNFLRKAKPDQRPANSAGLRLNKDGSVSKSQPPPYFERVKVYRDETDRKRLLYRIRAEAWEMYQVRKGRLPVYKNPSGSYPDQHCGGCEFRDVCELHETGSDWKELVRMTMTKWDPYKEHNGQA